MTFAASRCRVIVFYAVVTQWQSSRLIPAHVCMCGFKLSPRSLHISRDTRVWAFIQHTEWTAWHYYRNNPHQMEMLAPTTQLDYSTGAYPPTLNGRWMHHIYPMARLTLLHAECTWMLSLSAANACTYKRHPTSLERKHGTHELLKCYYCLIKLLAQWRWKPICMFGMKSIPIGINWYGESHYGYYRLFIYCWIQCCVIYYYNRLKRKMDFIVPVQSVRMPANIHPRIAIDEHHVYWHRTFIPFIYWKLLCR